MSGADGFEPEDSLSSDSRIELPADSGQFDLTAYAVALALNSSALPPGMPETMRAAVEARAQDIRIAIEQGQTADEFTESGAREKRRRDADERTDAQASIVIARQQHEREEWLRSPVIVAGTTMTGGEWQELSKRLREDDDLRERLMRLYMKRGMDQAEAEARVERVAEVAEIAAIPKGQRTEEQRETMKAAFADPTTKRDVQEAVQMAGKDSAPAVASSSKFNGSFARAADGNSADVAQTAQRAQAEQHVTATIGAGM